MKAIFFISFAPEVAVNPNTLLTQNKLFNLVPSVRLQVMPAVRALESNGYECFCQALHEVDFKKFNILEYSIIIYAKITANPQKRYQIHCNIKAINHISKKHNIPSIVIYSNNHLEAPSIWADTYKLIIDNASLVITPSASLQNAIAEFHSGKSLVIEDPLLYKVLPYRERNSKNKHVNILWYGNNKNLTAMIKKMYALYSLCPNNYFYSFRLLVGNLSQSKRKEFQKAVDCAPSFWEIIEKRWTQERHQQYLSISDYVLIPCGDDNFSLSASHNRLIDAISAGTLAIASPIPSYKELSKVAIITPHIADAMTNTISHYNKIINKFDQERPPIMERFSINKNLAKWHAALKSLNCK